MSNNPSLMVVEAVEGRVILMPGRGNKPVPDAPTIVPRNSLFTTAVAHGDLKELTGTAAEDVLAGLKPAAASAEVEGASKDAIAEKVAEGEVEQPEAPPTAAELAVEQARKDKTAAMKSGADAVKAAEAKTPAGRVVPKLS